MAVGLKNAIEGFRYFCAKHTLSFYAGMVFAVFGLLALTAYLPLAVSAALCPLVTVFFYVLGRLVKETPKELKESSETKQGILASFLGCMWVLLFVVI